MGMWLTIDYWCGPGSGSLITQLSHVQFNPAGRTVMIDWFWWWCWSLLSSNIWQKKKDNNLSGLQSASVRGGSPTLSVSASPWEKKESKASKWGVDVSDAHRRYAAKVWQRKESSYHPPSRRKRLSRTRPHPRTHREHMVVLSYLENASNAVDVNNTWQVNGSSLCLVSLINKKICLFLQLISCALLRQQMHLEMRRLQILLLVFSVHSVSRP